MNEVKINSGWISDLLSLVPRIASMWLLWVVARGSKTESDPSKGQCNAHCQNKGLWEIDPTT